MTGNRLRLFVLPLFAMALSDRLRRLSPTGVLFAGFFALAGCALPGAGVDIGGELKLLYAPFSLTNPPRYWHYSPAGNKAAAGTGESPLQWQDKDGKIALALRPGIAPFELGRRTNIIVLASPFLSFDWQLNNTAQAGDVELVLGFRRQDAGDWAEHDLGSGKPPIDQVVRIPVGQANVNYGVWQRDYFDLSTLYRRYWPDARGDEVRLVWIGITSGKRHKPAVSSVTYLTHILLSR